MKKFENPEMTVETMLVEDVITTSLGGGNANSGSDTPED